MADSKISDLTAKVTPAGADTFVIVDSVALDNKKVTLTNLQSNITITESQISDLQSYLLNVVEDTTPQLGGNLDAQTNQITDVGKLICGLSSYTHDAGAPVAIFSSGTVDRVAVFESTDSGAYAAFTDNTTTLDYGVRVGAIGNDLALDANQSQVALLSDTFAQFNVAVGSDGEFDNGNSSTADTIEWDNGNFQKSTLTGNCTYTFNAPDGPARLQLKLIQDATGSRTVTWPASVKWASGTAPTLSTAASAVDIVTLYYDGTNYYGSGGDQNFS